MMLEPILTYIYHGSKESECMISPLPPIPIGNRSRCRYVFMEANSAHQQYLPFLLVVVLLGAGHGTGLGVAHGAAGLRADRAVVRRPHGGACTVQGQIGDAGGPAVIRGGGETGENDHKAKRVGGRGEREGCKGRVWR